MTVCRKTLRSAVLVALCLLSGSPAAADQDTVYESLAEVPVGRVFLSRAQRSMLDDGRAGEPLVQQAPTRPIVQAPPSKKKRRPAGYIVSSTGESRVWSARGFVTTRTEPGMRFPGDVSVTRSETDTAEDQAAVDGHDAESSSEGS